jgi:hypothetical protein
VAKEWGGIPYYTAPKKMVLIEVFAVRVEVVAVAVCEADQSDHSAEGWHKQYDDPTPKRPLRVGGCCGCIVAAHRTSLRKCRGGVQRQKQRK